MERMGAVTKEDTIVVAEAVGGLLERRKKLKGGTKKTPATGQTKQQAQRKEGMQTPRLQCIGKGLGEKRRGLAIW